jgi:hypothetical protein
VNVDVSVFLNGYHGDLNETFFVGKVDDVSRRLVQTTYECLQKAIEIGRSTGLQAPPFSLVLRGRLDRSVTHDGNLGRGSRFGRKSSRFSVHRRKIWTANFDGTFAVHLGAVGSTVTSTAEGVSNRRCPLSLAICTAGAASQPSISVMCDRHVIFSRFWLDCRKWTENTLHHMLSTYESSSLPFPTRPAPKPQSLLHDWILAELQPCFPSYLLLVCPAVSPGVLFREVGEVISRHASMNTFQVVSSRGCTLPALAPGPC